MSLPSYMANIAPAYGDVPPRMDKVCPECPWRKENKVGQYHPAGGAGIFPIVEKGVQMACHMSMQSEYIHEDSKPKRCMGIEVFRANIGVQSEAESDTKVVFASKEEAVASWPKPEPNFDEALKRKFFRDFPQGHYIDASGLSWVAGKRAPDHDAGCKECGVF